MSAEVNILEYLKNNPEGASVSNIASFTGHTRATTAKYLELLKMQNVASFREIGKAKLWALSNPTKKILIAEDEPHIRRLIKVILGESYKYLEAKDGLDVLEKVSDEMPDLILLDVMMPKKDGMAVCKELKKNALTKKIPIMMLTAKKEIADKLLGISYGAEDYLTKPFEPRELRSRVRTFLDNKNTSRNQITNLPTFESSRNKLEKLDKNYNLVNLKLENLDVYKKYNGYYKTNELLRLTTQVISHILENYGNQYIYQKSDDTFILALFKDYRNEVIDDIKKEFEETIPFFYEKEFEFINWDKNEIRKRLSKGKILKIPLVNLTTTD